jgi:predicted RND superfamily exporter protein
MNEPTPPTPVIWDDFGKFLVWGIGVIMIFALFYFMKLILSSSGSDDDEDEEENEKK